MVAGLLAGVSSVQPLSGQSASAASAELSDRGSFDLFSAGKQIGTETFEIRMRDGRIEARGEDRLQVGETRAATEIRASSTLVLDSQLHPLSYAWSQKGTKSSQLAVDFRSKPAHVRYVTVNGQEDRREFALPADVIVLDDNAIYHYQLTVARYDQAKGGKQVLRAFTPQEALPGAVTLNFAGSDAFPGDPKKRSLRHYVLTTELTQIDLWTDERGRLQGVSTPGAQFQAVRKK